MKQIAADGDRGCLLEPSPRPAGSNFSYAFLVLPKPKREALYAIYAFCRVTDDLVDESLVGRRTGAATPAERLKAWRAELDACFRGEATHPVTRRLADVSGTAPGSRGSTSRSC